MSRVASLLLDMRRDWLICASVAARLRPGSISHQVWSESRDAWEHRIRGLAALIIGGGL